MTQTQVGDAQGLVHCEFIPDWYTINRNMYIKILHASGMQREGNVCKNGHERADFFCMTKHLHIGQWWSKVLCQIQRDGLGAFTILLGIVTALLFLFP
jgi:hypothetical protein